MAAAYEIDNQPLFNELVSDLAALLDLIEAEDDASLSLGRFDIFRKHGLEVVFTGEPGTGTKN